MLLFWFFPVKILVFGTLEPTILLYVWHWPRSSKVSYVWVLTIDRLFLRNLLSTKYLDKRHIFLFYDGKQFFDNFELIFFLGFCTSKIYCLISEKPSVEIVVLNYLSVHNMVWLGFTKTDCQSKAASFFVIRITFTNLPPSLLVLVLPDPKYDRLLALCSPSVVYAFFNGTQIFIFKSKISLQSQFEKAINNTL